MRRITVVGMIILGLVAVPLIAAAKVSPKVSICHFDGSDVGRVIEVSGNALEAHETHGDFEVESDNPDPCDTPPVPQTELPNQAPTADIRHTGGCFVSCEYIFDGSFSSDPDGDALTYQWTVSRNGVFVKGSTEPIWTWYGGVVDDIYTVTLIVSDGDLSGTAEETFTAG